MNSRSTPLWQYRNQVDQEYYGRLKLFLIFESILSAAAVQVDSSGHASSTVSKVFVLLGLLITLVWLYAQARVAHILSYLRSLCNEYLPEYRLFRVQVARSSTLLLTYGMPILIAFIWIALLFI